MFRTTPLNAGATKQGRASRKERVKTRQGDLKTSGAPSARLHARSMIEIVIAGIIALALLGYLLYALIRPEKF